MAFMQPEVMSGEWFVLDGLAGVVCVPAQFVNLPLLEGVVEWEELDERSREVLSDFYLNEPSTVETRSGWGARMNAPGYLDCTDWTVFDTEEEAWQFLEDYFEVYPCKQCGVRIPAGDSPVWDEDMDEFFCSADCQEEFESEGGR